MKAKKTQGRGNASSEKRGKEDDAKEASLPRATILMGTVRTPNEGEVAAFRDSQKEQPKKGSSLKSLLEHIKERKTKKEEEKSKDVLKKNPAGASSATDKKISAKAMTPKEKIMAIANTIKTKLVQKPITNQKPKEQKPPRRRKKQVEDILLKAGIDDPLPIERAIFRLSVLGTLLGSFWALFLLCTSRGITWEKVALGIGSLWTFGFLGIMFCIWMVFYVYVDYRILKRRQEIEEILPDFLQLTSANIKAGMTVDRALWYAVRPNFGVLAREIEIVAKETMGGEDLRDALRTFAAKYDSQLLHRSIALINEGIESGGEIGDLLIKVAANIEDQKIMMKEMSANVTTYVIFITFSSIVAAPFLFALSGVLIDVLHQISTSLAQSGTSGASGMGFSFSGSGVTAADFRIFAMVELTISAIFSAVVLSTIKKGNIREGTKNIPVFVFIALSLYLFASSVAGAFMGFFF